MSGPNTSNGIDGVSHTEKEIENVGKYDSNTGSDIKSEPKSSAGNRTPHHVPEMAASTTSDRSNSPAPSLPPSRKTHDPAGLYEQAWDRVRSKPSLPSTKSKAPAPNKTKASDPNKSIAPTKQVDYNFKRMKAPWADRISATARSVDFHTSPLGLGDSFKHPNMQSELSDINLSSKYPSIRNKNVLSQQPDESPYGGTEFEEDWQHSQSSENGQYSIHHGVSPNSHSMTSSNNRYAHEDYENGNYGASSHPTIDAANSGRSARNTEPSFRRTQTTGGRGASFSNRGRGSSSVVMSDDEDSSYDVDYALADISGPRKRSRVQSPARFRGRSKTSRHRSGTSGKRARVANEDENVDVGGSSKDPPFHPFSQDTYVHALDESAGPEPMGPPVRRLRAQASMEDIQDGGSQRSSVYDDEEEEEAGELFNNPGRNLKPSRYSGAEMAWGTNTLPSLVNQEDVSDASLLKRGLKRGQADKICKRGYGANDPENVKIVNLRESGLTFEKIKNQLNTQRIKLGYAPSLTVCGITARYNRTAPLLFAARGEEFVPLSQRRRGAASNASGRRHKFQWTDDYDLALVKCYKDVEAKKWTEVAALFREISGEDVDEEAVAVRHTML